MQTALWVDNESDYPTYLTPDGDISEPHPLFGDVVNLSDGEFEYDVRVTGINGGLKYTGQVMASIRPLGLKLQSALDLDARVSFEFKHVHCLRKAH